MKIGIPVSPGIGIGKVLFIEGKEINPAAESIAEKDLEKELAKFDEAVAKSKGQLDAIYQELLAKGDKNAEIIQANIFILEDPMLHEQIIEMTKDSLCNVAYAIKQVVDEQIKVFEAIEDPYIRERAADVQDVGQRLIKNVLDIPIQDLSKLNEDIIIVSEDLLPSQIASMDTEHVKGLISETGAATSHAAILARSFGIPAILGCKGIKKQLLPKQTIAVDGTVGRILMDLDERTASDLNEKIRSNQISKEQLKALKGEKTQTLDGKQVELSANIGSTENLSKVIANGAEGIGLFRTEFVFMDRKSLPNEDDQFKEYKQVVEGMEGKPVIIRTMDIGGDKDIPYMKLPKEENPFLGWRAIRICFDEIELFKNQLKAILRASAFGKVKIMYPMIASVGELRRANAILAEAEEELRQKGIAFDENIETGIMVEIPAAAVNADILIKEADFFSIGTNDLTQYTLAVDRTNERVSNIYNSLEPAVLRLIQNAIFASHKADKWTGMCGELAGNPLAVIPLLGMGLDEFSVNPASVLKVRKIINSVTIDFARNVASQVMQMEEAEQIEAYLKQVLVETNLAYILEI